MYSLDINFLNDREDRAVEVRSTRRTATAVPVGDRRPLLFGLAAGLAAVALVGGYWLVLRNQVSDLRARSAQLDQELAQVQSQLQELSGIQGQIAAVEAEIGAFVTIFNQILPWSALLQDLRNSTPARVQIESLSQTAGETLTNQGATEPPLAGGIQVVGKACSFDDVNDFLLLLQRSPLLDANSVRLVSSQRPEEPLPEEQGNCPGTPPGAPEFLVDYTIQANLTPTPATELVEDLENRGTVGLVSRIRALRETGALNQSTEPAVTETTNAEPTN